MKVSRFRAETLMVDGPPDSSRLIDDLTVWYLCAKCEGTAELMAGGCCCLEVGGMTFGTGPPLDPTPLGVERPLTGGETFPRLPPPP